MVTRTELEGKALNDGYQRLCLNHEGYRSWKKQDLARAARAGTFDGIEIAEPHWPEYPGPASPAFGCFCDACRQAFRRMFPGEPALPDIVHNDSPLSPGRNPTLWEKYLRFRQASLTAFLDDLVNGAGGLRQTCPGVQVGTWTLALAEQDGVRRVRADSGEDAGEVAATVRPDLHCLQTHWPD